MLIKPSSPPAPSLPEREVTDHALYLDRRDFISTGLKAMGALALGGGALAPLTASALMKGNETRKIPGILKAPAAYRVDEEMTEKGYATGYNNFYELDTDKETPAKLADRMRIEPWSVEIAGQVGKPGVIGLEDLIRPHTPEERIYRLRCVEAWSMVIPWVGIPLAKVLERFEPTSKAKHVRFETLYDPEQLPGQRRRVLDWPYREGLRIDEAMHPLTILAIGMYGETLPGQNGAPLRLVVPWKYGFKCIKSIVKIELTERQPATSWNQSAPNEYGYFANVNPEVDHPRWSQARERRIGDWLKRPTLPFNGYGEQVAGLYRGMDLRKHF